MFGKISGYFILRVPILLNKWANISLESNSELHQVRKQYHPSNGNAQTFASVLQIFTISIYGVSYV